MSSRIAKVWICAKEFKGEVQLDNFELIEEELKPIEDDEFIAETKSSSALHREPSVASNISKCVTI